MTHQIDPRLANLGFHHIEPSPLLRPYVWSYWYFRRDTPLGTYQEEYMHPTGGFGIVFNFADVMRLDGNLLSSPISLDGANTISRKMEFSGTFELLGIRFREGGAYPFFAMPLAELRNEVAILDALDRPSSLRDLYGRLVEAHSLAERISLIEQWLIRCLSQGKDRESLIPATLAALKQMVNPSVEPLAMPQLAEQFAISQRQLERLYQNQVGFSPKQYTQLLRIQTARLALKKINGESITRLAADLGFYDQSHFTREFNAVIGVTPSTYLKRSRKRYMPTE
jgi:AraC-like DNA-binding protein